MLLKGRDSEGKVSIGSIHVFIRIQTILQQKQQQQNKASILNEKLENPDHPRSGVREISYEFPKILNHDI